VAREEDCNKSYSRESTVKPAFLQAGARDSAGCLPQHEPHTFRRQPMPIPDALIIGLGIGEAEFGLVEKQKRRLLGLETTGFKGLAVMIRAFAATARLGRKNAALLAATGQGEFSAHHS
jgi:hypothetical protein